MLRSSVVLRRAVTDRCKTVSVSALENIKIPKQLAKPQPPTVPISLAEKDLQSEIAHLNRKYPNYVVLIQVGKFYEVYSDSRFMLPMSRLLSLKIASRKSVKNPILEFIGFPVFKLDHYLDTITKNGYTAAIVDQIGPNMLNSTKLQKRAVVKIVSPGTHIADPDAAVNSNSFIMVVCLPQDYDSTHNDKIGLSWSDVSTREFYTCESSINSFESDFARISPTEIIVNQHHRNSPHPTIKFLQSIEKLDHISSILSFHSSETFNPVEAKHHLDTLLINSKKGLSTIDNFTPLSIHACGVMLSFLSESFPSLVDLLKPPEPIHSESIMKFDSAVIRALELSKTLYEGKSTGTVLNVMDRTCTGMGARLLGARLRAPSQNINEINTRLDLVQFFLSSPYIREIVQRHLRKCGDLERYLQRLHMLNPDASDLMVIDGTLMVCKELADDIQEFSVRNSKVMDPSVEGVLRDLRFDKRVSEVSHGCWEEIGDEEEGSKKWKVAKGTSKKYDKLRKGMDGLLSRKSALEERLKETYGIQYTSLIAKCCGLGNVELKENKSHGAIFEIRGKARPNLKEILEEDEDVFMFEAKKGTHKEWTSIYCEINTTQDRLVQCETEIVHEKRNQLLKYKSDISSTSQALASLDVALSSSLIAHENYHTRPIVTEDETLEIEEGRHPIVEYMRKTNAVGGFVSNNAWIGGRERVWVITGPNMGGKSTFLRQVCLTSILAQAGFYVPAKRARLGIVDKILTRIGTSDNLNGDQSSFMVEMMETNNILKNATKKSLVVLDEVGRGTSISDAIGINYGLLRHFNGVLKCRTLISTHFKELKKYVVDDQQLDKNAFGDVVFYKTTVAFLDNRPVYTYKFVAGVCEDSHGLLVASLAGVPDAVVSDAKKLADRISTPGLN